jgi:dTDP-4-dehydrorhamnose reductase
MKKKKIYISGCGGMLGEAFYKVFGANYELKCSDIDLNEEWLTYLDFRNFEYYWKDVAEFKPDYLFHLGAFTDLEFCESNKKQAYETNTISVENAVYISNKLDIPILYISTAGIFDGSKDIFDDWDQPNPLGNYARSKYAGELFVLNNAKRHLICRAGWMMGGGPKKDKKFIQKIMLQIKQGKNQLFIVDDKFGTPTYTHDFAANVKLLIEKEFWGLYNMVCEGVTGRLEVAQELIQILGLHNDVKVIPVNSDYWKNVYFASRPPSERLINEKLNIRGLNIMRDWRLCLKEYVDEYYSCYLNK